MPAPSTQYESTRFVHNFVRKDGAVVQNGTLAQAQTFAAIADNQHWLALTDQPLINFFVAQYTAWVGASTRTVTLMVPPFAQYASFHFLCARDLAGGASLSYISVASPTQTRSTTAIPMGEDLGATGKGSLAVRSANWLHFSDVGDNPTASDPGAVKLFPWTLEYWRTVDVEIVVSADVTVYAAAYRVLPQRDAYTVYA